MKILTPFRDQFLLPSRIADNYIKIFINKKKLTMSIIRFYLLHVNKLKSNINLTGRLYMHIPRHTLRDKDCG